MKKLLFITLLGVFTGFALKAEKLVKKGKTETALGSYTIHKTGDFVVIDDIALPTYVISYQNSAQIVKVAVDKDKKNGVKHFIVLGDNLNIQYVCVNTYFGVEKLGKKYIILGIKATSSEALNKVEYYNQKVLTRSEPTDRDCLGLIACYYPKLVTNYKTAFVDHN